MADTKREHWGSKIGFILAAAGSAIGLGNIWKFPYIAGENGGAAFIFVYLICIALIGLPVLMGEILLGRTSQKNPVGAFRALTKSKFWPLVGFLGVIAGFTILSFYSVVAGWATGYITEAIMNNFSLYNETASSGEHFNSLVSNPYWIIGYDILFMAVSMLIVYAGINKGIERGSKILMPMLFVLLLISMVRGLTLDGAQEGINFLLKPDWSQVTGNSVLIALGHAFFTLSLGMGAMMTYGSYMSEKDNIPNAALQIVFLDTLIALMAGVAIFTSVFATGLDPAGGPGLIFQTLPVVFSKMPGGYIFAIFFFLLLTIAALTSAISLLEVVVSYFVDEKGYARHKAVLLFGTLAFAVSVPSALSFNYIADFKIAGLTFFDLMDFLASNIFLPLGGLLMSIFIAWRWGLNNAVSAIKKGADSLFDKHPYLINLWIFFLKYLSPILIFLVLLHSAGLLEKIIHWF